MKDNTKELEESRDNLRKSLASVGFKEEEIADLIEKSEKIIPEEKNLEDSSEGKNLVDLEKAYKEFETKETDLEKAYNGDKTDISEKKSALMAEMKEKGYKEEKPIEKAIDNDLEKSKDEKDVIIKGLNTKIDELEKKVTNTEEFDELKKSVEGVTESISSIKDLVTKIANTPNGMKSHQYSNFLEKANGDNDLSGENKTVISLRDKEKLTKSLESLAESCTDQDRKNHFEKAIMDYNSNPDAQLAPSLIADIQKAENCTFVA